MHEVINAILPGDLIFDIGANSGVMTEWYLSRGARVVSVEPQPREVETLKARFGSDPRVTILQKGLGSAPGLLSMSISPHSVLSTFSERQKAGRHAHLGWIEQVDVEMTTLDILIRDFGVPRFIKVDVEGFESEVIAGLNQKAGAISIEFVAENIEETKTVCARLFDLGYRQFNVSLGDHETFIFGEWGDREKLFEAMAEMIANDSLLWGDVYAN